MQNQKVQINAIFGVKSDHSLSNSGINFIFLTLFPGRPSWNPAIEYETQNFEVIS